MSSAMRYYYPPNLLDYQPRVDNYDSEITVSVDYLSSDGTRYGTTIQAQHCCHVCYIIIPTLTGGPSERPTFCVGAGFEQPRVQTRGISS